MDQINEFFKPETFFSRDNLFLKSTEKTHRLLFETVDKAARLQLALVEDLLGLNRERFESLYTCQSVTDLIESQKKLATDLGERTARYAGDLQEVVTGMQAEASEAANDFAAAAKPRKSSAKSKKAA